MTKATVGRKSESTRHHAVVKHEKEGLELIKSYLPPGSPQRTAAGITAAVVGALAAAALVGAGPAALAGAAGYLVYQETHQS